MAYPEDLTDAEREILGREMREDVIDRWVTNVVKSSGVDALKVKIGIIKDTQSANPYDEMRRRKYPSIGDQLDALYHAGVFPDAMAAEIKKIKDAYAKG
jgi:hypothetical protein